MDEPGREPLIHDWNLGGPGERPAHRLRFCDETLRDGLQSPSVFSPPIDRKMTPGEAEVSLKSGRSKSNRKEDEAEPAKSEEKSFCGKLVDNVKDAGEKVKDLLKAAKNVVAFWEYLFDVRPTPDPASRPGPRSRVRRFLK
jgi:hypothetical protein